MKALCGLLALVTVVVANAFVAQPRADADLDWWQNAVIYQIYPRSFKDSDGDGIGDLNGITEKLDHVKDIGAAGVWLSPIFTSPMADFGYDISNFTDIDPLFGTMEDFDKLVEKARKLGLKVILDFVPNHSSDEHEWFVKSVNKEEPYTDYYVWHNGTWNGTALVPPNNWQSVFGGPAWTWHEDRQEFYLHQFHPKQPDLNYNSILLVLFMEDVLRFWLDKGVDGFRVDAIPHLFEGPIDDRPENETSAPTNLNETYEMVGRWRRIMDIKSLDQTKLLMLEAYGSLDQTMRYYGTPEAPGGHFPFNFRLITDVNFGRTSAKEISATINEYLERMTDGRTPNWVLGNHDQHRVASRFVPELVDGLNFIAQLLPGVGVTYNGEEIGMENTNITWEQCVDPQGKNAGEDGYLEVTRDLERTPFQWDNSTSAGFSKNETTWLPVNENYKELNLEAQKAAEKSHYKVYKQLTELRKNPAIQRGKTHVAALSETVLGFTRTLDNEDSYVVVVNFGSDTETVNVKETFSEMPDKITMYLLSINSEHMAGHKMSATELEVGPLEAYVFVYTPEPSFGNIILPSSFFVLIVQFVVRYL